MTKSKSEGSRSGRGSHKGIAGGLIVGIGLLVGGNFALAKYLVMADLSPFLVFYWQISGATLILTLMMLCRSKMRLPGAASIALWRYCIIGGILGISLPQIMGYFALRDVPAGLFTMVVTLSPLLTFLAASVYERRMLPIQRGLGLLIGLGGICLAVLPGLTVAAFSVSAIGVALCVPILLAITNVFRDKAYPTGSNPLFLATATLGSQVVLLGPLGYTAGAFDVPLQTIVAFGLYLAALMAITALSYILTFELYRHTDGVGFSQVGYFATLSGVAAGSLFFGENISLLFTIAVLLLFSGMALANGVFTSKTKLNSQFEKLAE
jgi:drug/metabolite transporter (DMT)-like permease